MKNKTLLVISILFNIILLFFVFKQNKIEYIDVIKTDTITTTDTLLYIKPTPTYIAQTKTIRDTLKTSDTITKYVEVEIPIETKTYQDSTYYAVISGYKAHLDTLSVYPKETTITIEKTSYRANNRLKIRPSINIGVGYGVITRNPDVYVGIGGSLTF